jgi:hypothetical protein
MQKKDKKRKCAAILIAIWVFCSSLACGPPSKATFEISGPPGQDWALFYSSTLPPPPANIAFNGVVNLGIGLPVSKVATGTFDGQGKARVTIPLADFWKGGTETAIYFQAITVSLGQNIEKPQAGTTYTSNVVEITR